MSTPRIAHLLLCCFVTVHAASGGMAAASEHWPDFRGPCGDGHSTAKHVPLRWSESENVAWKIEIPGRGWSSPVIWDDQVWLTTATLDGTQRFAICVDRRSGRMVHNVRVFEVAKPQSIDPTNSYASPSPVIEEGRVYVHFGSAGTACFNTRSGEILWQRRDFPVDHQKGAGSSPVLYRDLLIFPCDGNDVQRIVAVDKKTGKTAWIADRSVDLSQRAPDYRKSFSTPLISTIAGRDQVISTAAGAVYGYDPQTGTELWNVPYGGHTMVARPVTEDGLLVVNTGYPSSELWGLRFRGGTSSLKTEIIWQRTRGIATIPSVLLHQGLIYMISDSGGVLSCLEAETGGIVWQKRLGGNYAASPVLADDRIYLCSQAGKTTVIRPGPRFQQLAVNQLDGGFRASPAVADRSLFLRTTNHLYRIEEERQ